MSEKREFKAMDAPVWLTAISGLPPLNQAELKPVFKIMLGVIFPLIIFLILAADIHHGKIYAFDHSFLLMLHAHATPLLDQWALGISAAINIFSVLFLIYLCYRRWWHTALFWLLAVGGAAILNYVAKHVIQRSRPALWQLVSQQSTFSFPSGHTTEAMAIAVALFVLLRAGRHVRAMALAGGAFVLATSLSRMYLGLHYPSDIAGSYLLSTAWVIGLSLCFDGYARTSRTSPLSIS